MKLYIDGGKIMVLKELKDRAAFIKIFKIIGWLDKKRWDSVENYINFFREDLTNCEKILTHWICYITDRQMPYAKVWDNGGYVFSELVYGYSRSDKSPLLTIQKHYESYLNNKGEEKYRFKSTDNVPFASRYVTNDYYNILQTLEVLNTGEYARNIVSFIVDIMRRFQNEEDLLMRIACSLHLLTYQLVDKKSNPEKILKILNDDEAFNKALKKFKNESTHGKKRLWCCVRDYKKGIFNRIFTEAIKEVDNINAGKFIQKWNELPMSQIELPGDLWNNRPVFRNNLFKNVLNLEEIPKTWEMPIIIRTFYNQVKNDEELIDSYPEQFDITFDFVPRMCTKKLCKVCPFGKYGAESICIPSKEKNCPVSLVCCGYISKCVGDKDNCIIKENLGKGICQGIKQ